jgi:hypothetical protein
MAYDPNFMDMLTAGTDDDARAQARIMAEQLRGDKQLGMMGQLGGKRASGLGKEMLSDADQAEKGLLTAGVNRLHFGQQAQDLKREKFSTDMLRALAVQQAKNEGSSERGDVLRQIAELRAAQAGQAAAGKDGAKLATMGKAEYDKLAKEWDPAQQVRSAFGQAGQQDLQAIRGLALKMRSGERFNPNELQQAELAGVLGRMVTGGVPTKATLEHFNPGSAQKLVAHAQSWISGKPVTTDMVEWADSMIKMLEGESEAAKNFVRKNRLENSERLRRYSQIDPDSARRFLKSKGMDVAHPQGYIDPETFEVRNFNPNASSSEVAGLGAKAAPAASGGRFTHPAHPGKFFDADGNEVP